MSESHYGLSKTRVVTILRQQGVTIRSQGLTPDQIEDAAELCPRSTGKASNHGRELAGNILLNREIREAPAFPAVVQSGDDLVDVSDQGDRRGQHFVGLGSKGLDELFRVVLSVVGDTGDLEPGMYLEFIESLTGSLSDPRQLVVDACG